MHGLMAKQVLVVEDNPDNRTLIVDILLSLDYKVLVAPNGVECLRLLQSSRPDLILMDLSLPKLDGWEATRRIKSDPKLSDIPIIALTAHAMFGDREKALEAGCDSYIPKPVDFRELTSKLHHYLGE